MPCCDILPSREMTLLYGGVLQLLARETERKRKRESKHILPTLILQEMTVNRMLRHSRGVMVHARGVAIHSFNGEE